MKRIKTWIFLLCILLWDLGSWLVIDGYRRDFLIVKRLIPVFLIFFVLQTAIALGSCIISFLKAKPESPWKTKIEKIFSKKAWIITFLTLKLALCVIALVVMLFIAGMVVAYVSTIE